MDDLISRQAVLKLLSTMPPEEAITKAMLIQSVKQMDAVQPEKRTEERTEKHACDCISRQAAIDAVHEEFDDCLVWDESGKRTADEFETIIDRLPSAQPERQKGEWIDYTEDGYVECPFCHSATNCDGNEDELHFCFSCGADMREVIE